MSEPEFLSPKYYQQQFKAMKRLTRILEKMRAAGISESEIKFLGDFWHKDTIHVQKVLEMSKEEEKRQAQTN